MVLASARGLLTGVIALLIAGVIGVAILMVGLGSSGFLAGPVHPYFGRIVWATFVTPALVAVIGVQAANLLRLPASRAFAHLASPVPLVELWIWLRRHASPGLA